MRNVSFSSPRCGITQSTPLGASVLSGTPSNIWLWYHTIYNSPNLPLIDIVCFGLLRTTINLMVLKRVEFVSSTKLHTRTINCNTSEETGPNKQIFISPKFHTRTIKCNISEMRQLFWKEEAKGQIIHWINTQNMISQQNNALQTKLGTSKGKQNCTLLYAHVWSFYVQVWRRIQIQKYPFN